MRWWLKIVTKVSLESLGVVAFRYNAADIPPVLVFPALRINPEYSKALTRRAFAHEALERLDEALRGTALDD